MTTLQLIIALGISTGIISYLVATLTTRRILRHHPDTLVGTSGMPGPQGIPGPQGDPGPTITCACPR